VDFCPHFLMELHVSLVAAADGMRVGAPIARPTAVVRIGFNYAPHAAESGVTPPTEPVVS